MVDLRQRFERAAYANRRLKWLFIGNDYVPRAETSTRWLSRSSERSYGLRLFEETQMDAIANCIADLATVAGVVMTHVKRPAPDAAQPRTIVT